MSDGYLGLRKLDCCMACTLSSWIRELTVTYGSAWPQASAMQRWPIGQLIQSAAATGADNVTAAATIDAHLSGKPLHLKIASVLRLHG